MRRTALILLTVCGCAQQPGVPTTAPEAPQERMRVPPPPTATGHITAATSLHRGAPVAPPASPEVPAAPVPPETPPEDPCPSEVIFAGGGTHQIWLSSEMFSCDERKKVAEELHQAVVLYDKVEALTVTFTPSFPETAELIYETGMFSAGWSQSGFGDDWSEGAQQVLVEFEDEPVFECDQNEFVFGEYPVRTIYLSPEYDCEQQKTVAGNVAKTLREQEGIDSVRVVIEEDVLSDQECLKACPEDDIYCPGSCQRLFKLKWFQDGEGHSLPALFSDWDPLFEPL